MICILSSLTTLFIVYQVHIYYNYLKKYHYEKTVQKEVSRTNRRNEAKDFTIPIRQTIIDSTQKKNFKQPKKLLEIGQIKVRSCQ